jgi:hypothetical protein
MQMNIHDGQNSHTQDLLDNAGGLPNQIAWKRHTNKNWCSHWMGTVFMGWLATPRIPKQSLQTPLPALLDKQKKALCVSHSNTGSIIVGVRSGCNECLCLLRPLLSHSTPGSTEHAASLCCSVCTRHILHSEQMQTETEPQEWAL